MGLESLGMHIIQFMTAQCASVIGTVFVLYAWVQTLKRPSTAGHGRTSFALWIFTCSVGTNFGFLAAFPYITDRTYEQRVLHMTLTSFLFYIVQGISFLLLVTTVVAVRRDKSAARKTIKVGSLTVLVFVVVGFVLSIFG